MTQTVLTRAKRATLEGQQFDKDNLRVGPYAIVNVRDAFTSRSAPGNRIRARNYVTIVIDVSEEQDASRTVEWLACELCNRISPSVSGIEAHITNDHANGSRRAGAGDVTEDLATAGDPVEEPQVPQQRTPDDAPAEPEAAGTDSKREREQRAFMEEARRTRRRYNELMRAAERDGRKLSKAEAAERLGIHRGTLDRRLKATEATAHKTYNTATPEETREAYEALIAEHGPLTLKEAGELLGMYPTTLSKRLRDTAPAVEEEAAGVEEEAAPVEEEPPAVEDEDDEDDDVEITGVIDPAREKKIEATVELVMELYQSRAEWKARAEAETARADRAEAERDEAVAGLEKVRAALGVAPGA